MKDAQAVRIAFIATMAELGVLTLAEAVRSAGFNPDRAWAAAVVGVNVLFVALIMVVLDHEARGRGK